jgi:hypothetical protein
MARINERGEIIRDSPPPSPPPPPAFSAPPVRPSPPASPPKEFPNEDGVCGAAALFGALGGLLLAWLVFGWTGWGLAGGAALGFVGLAVAAQSIIRGGDGAIGVVGVLGLVLALWASIAWGWAWYWVLAGGLVGFCVGCGAAGGIQDAAKRK